LNAAGVAHDLTSTVVLWPKLETAGISHRFVSCVKAIYNSAYAMVKTPAGNSEKIKINIGVLQGESLSPTLFNFAINDLPDTLMNSFTCPVKLGGKSLHCLLYADDVCLLAYSKESLQQKMDILRKYFIKNKLVLNANKSKVVIFANRASALPKFKWQSSDIESVKMYKHLGVTFYRNGNVTKNISDFTSKTGYFWHLAIVLQIPCPSVQQPIQTF